MKKTKLNVKTKNGKYSIIIGSNLSDKLTKIFKENFLFFNKCFLLIDKNIEKKTIKKLTNSINQKKIIYFFNSSEKNKNISTVVKILNLLQKNNFNRNDCLITIGGGNNWRHGWFCCKFI